MTLCDEYGKKYVATAGRSIVVNSKSNTWNTRIVTIDGEQAYLHECNNLKCKDYMHLEYGERWYYIKNNATTQSAKHSNIGLLWRNS